MIARSKEAVEALFRVLVETSRDESIQGYGRAITLYAEVTEFIAVLKAANYRSKALLEKLGFSAASPEQQALYRDEPDELVMVQSIGGMANAT